MLAVIPARAGSKGVVGKNLRPLAGRPLIAHTIEAALAAPSVARVIVSTDGEDIADVAMKYGAEVPFLRPAALARDDTPGVMPLLHAVEWLEQHEQYRPELVILLQPTSPLRTADDIEAAVQMMEASRPPAVVSVEPTKKHPEWMVRLDDDGAMHWLMGEGATATRRQDLRAAYALNGALYLLQRAELLAQKTVLPKGTLGYVMPAERSIDIDSELDLRVAESLLSDLEVG